jgi:hypothetical protein
MVTRNRRNLSFGKFFLTICSIFFEQKFTPFWNIQDYLYHTFIFYEMGVGTIHRIAFLTISILTIIAKLGIGNVQNSFYQKNLFGDYKTISIMNSTCSSKPACQPIIHNRRFALFTDGSRRIILQE